MAVVHFTRPLLYALTRTRHVDKTSVEITQTKIDLLFSWKTTLRWISRTTSEHNTYTRLMAYEITATTVEFKFVFRSSNRRRVVSFAIFTYDITTPRGRACDFRNTAVREGGFSL